jgi:hypothetical protein
MDMLRFQFTLANTFRATFWTAACLGSWVVATSEVPHARYLEYLNFPLVILMLGGPLIAIGALFGRTKVGLLIGGIVAVALAILLEAVS